MMLLHAREAMETVVLLGRIFVRNGIADSLMEQ
jgi:hypothetical protein